MLKVCPLAAFSALIGVVAGLARKHSWVPDYLLASIEHPYAAQVFGIVVGYLLIMRLNACLQRWDAGMAAPLVWCNDSRNIGRHDANQPRTAH